MGRHTHFRRRPAPAQLLNISPVVVARDLVPLLCLSLLMPVWQALTISAVGLLLLGTVFLTPSVPHARRLFALRISPVVVSMLLASKVSWVGTLTLLILPRAATNSALLQCHEKSILWPSTVVVSLFGVSSHRAT